MLHEVVDESSMANYNEQAENHRVLFLYMTGVKGFKNRTIFTVQRLQEVVYRMVLAEVVF